MIEFKIFSGTTLIHKTIQSKSRITIGRSEDNDLILNNPHVSRLEAIIERHGEQITLIDKSRNGILVDNQRISESVILPTHCRIHIYPFEIECLSLREAETIPIPILQKKDDKLTIAKSPSLVTTSKKTQTSYNFSGLVGESPPMQEVYELIQQVGDSPATVLIRGEHGTGKELVAHALHHVSQRRDKPFVPVNCAAIPIDLIESELFGYEKGVFTGAQTAKSGKIEEASGGSLFLDEVGELSMAAQAKLLRFLQEKAVMRLGSSREIPMDVRIITATNRDLEKSMKDGSMRSDLYYRLRVVQIVLPPLREHPQDIPALIKHFIGKIANALTLPDQPVITDEAIQLLQAAAWPGNVRQLENALYSAILRSRPSHIVDDSILKEDTSLWTSDGDTDEESPLEAMNKQALIQILSQHQWDTAKAAEVLKVSRGTVYYKMKKFGIEVPHSSSRRNHS